MYEEVLQRVISVTGRLIPGESEAKEITADSDVMEDLGLSSIDMFYFLSAIEDEFDCEISDNLLRKIVTVGDMAQIVLQIQEEKNK